MQKTPQLTGLLIIALLSAVLVLAAGVTYSYSLLTAVEGGAGVLIMLGTAGFLRLYRHRVSRRGLSRATGQALRIGIALGLLWVTEIGINNLVAPPVPARDVIDNIFWGVIAFCILALAACQAHQADRLIQGIRAGLWSGFASGLLACGMALGIIVFGMKFITHDPLNVQEWAALGSRTAAPTMAAYFAYETLAGAFGHLLVLGLGMGGLLGMVGGAIGKGVRAAGYLAARGHRGRPH